MKHRLSGSKSALADQCLYFARPDVEPADFGGAPRARRIGSAFHEGTERRNVLTPVEVLCERHELTAPQDIETVTVLLDLWRDWWEGYRERFPFRWRTEVPFAVRADGSTRELEGDRAHRDYSDVAEDEIPMTLDAVAWDHDKREVHVLDYKTGFATGEAAWAQLRTGAVGSAPPFWKARLHLIGVRLDGITAEREALSVEDIEQERGRISRRLRLVTSAEPNAGAHCAELYCPMRAVCPVTKTLARRLREPLAMRLEGSALTEPIRDNEHARALLEALPLIKAFIRQREQDLEAFADDNGGIVLADGTVRTRTDVPRRSVDLENARLRKALEARFGADFEKEIGRVNVSLAKAEKLIRAEQPKGQKEAAVRMFRAEVEATGAIRITTHKRWSNETEDDAEG